MRRRTSVLFAMYLTVVGAGLAVAASPGEMPITTSSPEAKALFLKARDMAGNMELAAAVRLFDQAIEKDPSFAMAQVLRATAAGATAYREGIAKAAEGMDRVSAGEKLWIMAEKAMAEGRPAEARQPLTELVQMFPGDKYVQMRAAGYYQFVANDNARALAHLQKATATDPTFAPAYNLIGYLQANKPDYKAAEKAFLRYIELQPDRPNPYDSYAELLMKMGRYDDSIAQYRKALQKDDRFLSAQAGIGNNLILKKDFDGARRAFEQQREKATGTDDQLDAMENVARSFIAEGHMDRAIETYSTIADQAKSGGEPARAVDAAFSAAFALTRSGNLPSATEWVGRAEGMVSELELPAAVKARLQRSVHLARARVNSAAGEFDRAQAEIDSVRGAIDAAENPGEIRALNEAMGSLALQQRHYTEAIQYLAKADDRNPYVLYQRASALEGAGRSTQAAELFRRVADWNGYNLNYALVRDSAKEKAMTAPVATAGRKKLP